MSLKGSPELRARLRSIKLAFKPLGKNWATDTASYARGHVPSKTGRLKRSIRVKNASQRRATVVGHYTASFVDAGAREHDIRAKKSPRLIFRADGRTIFARKVHKPRIGPRRFKRAAAMAALAKNPVAQQVIKQWNDAR